MDLCRGHVLLVGEGDFSFSVAFANKLNSRSDTKITSTSLLTKEELHHNHRSSEHNINIIKKFGVNVLHGVDATSLHTDSRFEGCLFDFIIFNFPHTGGKSNIKNNRKLLRNFFSSAVKMIRDDGKILMSLCRGQGGSPVDQPIRAWHDSWQVIAMAAYEYLIVVKVEPFNARVWTEYSSTGFRSLDRNFFTGESFTYHLKKSQAFTVPFTHGVEIENLEKCTVDGYTVKVNKYIEQKINRNVLMDFQHPITLTCKLLENLVTQTFTGYSLIKNLGYVDGKIIEIPAMTKIFPSKDDRIAVATGLTVEQGIKPKLNSCLVTESLITTPKNSIISVEDGHHRDAANKKGSCAQDNKPDKEVVSAENDLFLQSKSICTKEPFIEKFEKDQCFNINSYYTVLKQDQNGMQVENNNNFFLRNTLLDCNNLYESVEDENSICSGYGDVYKRTCVNSSSLPVQHEFVILFSCDAQKVIEYILKLLQELLSSYSVTLTNTTADNKSSCCNQYYVSDNWWCFDVGYKSANYFHSISCNQVGSRGPAMINRSNVKDVKWSKQIAYGGQVVTNHKNVEMRRKTTKICKKEDKSNLYAVIFNLDVITQVRYDIPDRRLLLTECDYFLKQFENLTPTDLYTYEPVSFYPPLWRHDLSFWEREDEIFNEERFMDIVRNIAGDAIEEVLLMNVWKDPVSGRISKCYRQIYQSQDKALSHEKAHDLQNAIRLCVEQLMRVELR